MNKNILFERLAEEGIPEHWYYIQGNGIKDEKLCIENENSRWLVYYSERGEMTDLRVYNFEADACEDFYRRLKSLQEFKLKQSPKI